MSGRNWSAQQIAIFDWFRKETGNLVVRARAGTGKTTTLIEAVQQAPERDALVAAFNKRIAKELQDRLARGAFGNAEAKTLHGVGFSIVGRYWERVNVDGKRGYELAKRAAGEQAPDEMIGKVAKLAGIGKGSLADYSDEVEVLEQLEALAVRFGLEPDDAWQQDGWTTGRLVRHAWEAMKLASHRDERPVIDYDDMLFLPLFNNWARPRYSLVCVDEAQDMNAAQLELARRVCRDDGRIAVIGDDRQAIYGFRGADSDAIDRLKQELQAKELGLTCTYRCGKAIVAYAKQLVPDFVAAETNGDGVIEDLHESKLVDTAKPGDFVLSRKNAPLVSICLRMLRAGKPARIEGKDVAAGLRAIAKKWKPRSVGELMERIERWRDREVERLEAKKTTAADERIETVRDQADILLALCEGLASPAELLTRLDSLFGDSEEDRRPTVICSSIHKSKGLEAKRVFVLRNTLYPNRFSRRGREKRVTEEEALEAARRAVEEQNLEYVAVTRAIDCLVWVS